MPQQPSWLVTLGLAKETTWGTAVNPATAFLSAKAPLMEDNQTPIRDTSFRGVRSMLQSLSFGEALCAISTGDMPVYPQETGHLIMGMLGTDTISGAGPYTHTMTALNTGAAPSYTVAKFDGLVATSRQSAGVYWEELAFKFKNPGAFTLNAKGRGQLSTNATKSTASYTTDAFWVPWQGVLTLGGSANARLIECDLNFRAPTNPIFGISNVQSMTASVPGQLTVDGSALFAPIDYTEFNYYLNNTQPVWSIIFASGTNTITFQMSKLAFIDGTLQNSKQYTEAAMKFEAVSNATDGSAPVKVILVNNRSTAY